MNITVDFPEREVGEFARQVFDDQMPFATSLAINNTAKVFQRRQRDRLREIFTIRRKRFADRSILIKPFATKQSPEAKVSVDSPPVGPANDDLFAKFESDRTKSPFRGNSIAVPTEHVPRTPTGVIKKGWRPKDLKEGGAQHGAGRVFTRRGNVYKGAKRTVLIRKPGGRGTIFQRTDEGLRPLYQLVPRARIDPDLHFVDTANQVVNQEWEKQFGSAFDRATRTARRR